jgi:hypothetical protein
MTQNRVVSTLGDSSIGGKNRIANGDFSLWSRGTSFTASGWSADEFLNTTDSTYTVSRQSFTPGTAPVAGYESQYFLRIAKASGGTYAENSQYIDSVRTFAGQTVTFSFWLKTSVATTIRVRMSQNFGTGGSSQVDNTATDFTSTTSWARYSLTFNLASISGKTIGTNSILVAQIVAVTSSAVNVDIWGEQLEAGSTATTFTTSGGNPNLEAASAGSAGFDGVLVSTNSSTNGSGSGTNGWAGYQVAGKNAIINGGMDFWQRGTSSNSNGTGGYFAADRWYIVSSGTATHSRDTDVPSNAGVQYSQKILIGASSSYGQAYQLIEQDVVRSLRGQTVTLSAYFKSAGSYSGGMIMSAEYSTTADTWSNTWISSGSTNFFGSTVTSWTRKSITFTVPSNAVGLRLAYVPDAVQPSGVSVWHTGWQLELGSVATPFSRAGGTIQGELAACQRYYFRHNAGSGYARLGISGYCNTTTAAYVNIIHPVPLRAPAATLDIPALSNLQVYDGTAVFTPSGIYIDQGSYMTTSLYITSTGYTANRNAFLHSNNTTNGYIGLGAEL